MKTINANLYFAEHGPFSKFPHTGPLYFGSGARPYSAVLKGEILRRADGKVREFKTADAAAQAVLKAGEAV